MKSAGLSWADTCSYDGGGTAQFSYDALNQRVRIDKGSTAVAFTYNQNGQRTDLFDGNSFAELRNQYYWGATPIAWYDINTHFQH